MIIETFEQCSPEWFASRCGRPTASGFSKIITTKGEPSKQIKQYMFQLAGEAILGMPEETYCNAAMQRGKDLEGEARQLYEFITGDTVEQVGMVYRDERKLYACSPDGIVAGKNKGLEIKCPKLSTHIEYLLVGKLPSDYFQQVHGSIFITEFGAWDFMSYYPGLPPLIVTVGYDNEFCVKLEDALEDFSEKLENIKGQIKLKQG